MARIRCIYTIEDWKEEISEMFSEGSKCSSVRACGPIAGDIVGAVSTHYLLAYVSEKTGRFNGYTRISGAMAGREGTFLVEELGEFDASTVRSQLTVVPGSGTGGFLEVFGTGSFVTSYGNSVESEFDLEFAESVEHA